MKKRPTSITVICWIMIVAAVFGLIFTTAPIILNYPIAKELMRRTPIPVLVHSVMGYFVLLLCGNAMLKGQNKGRFIYVTWAIFSLVVTMATSSMATTMIPGFIGFLIITFFLFRPKANKYFS